MAEQIVNINLFDMASVTGGDFDKIRQYLSWKLNRPITKETAEKLATGMLRNMCNA